MVIRSLPFLFRKPRTCLLKESRYDENENAVILAMENDIPSFGNRHTLSIGASPEETAHLLFRRLRETDEMGVSLVLAQGWEGEEMVLAVMNRMARAAAFDVVKL